MTRLLCQLCLLFSLAGCAGGGGIQYYLIDPEPGSAPGDRDGSDLTVEIIDVELPRYLDRNQIVRRGADGTLHLSSGHQWGENLRLNLLRTLAQNLGMRLASADVGTPRARSAARPDFRVSVFIDAFEPDPQGRVVLLARWQVLDGGGSVLDTQRSRLEWDRPVGTQDHPGLVRAMAGLYGRLADEIAAAIHGRAQAGQEGP